MNPLEDIKKYSWFAVYPTMIHLLGLHGNALLVFSFIQSYTRDNKDGFRGTCNMARVLDISKRGVQEILHNLEKDGYITVTEDKGVKVYRSNFEDLLERIEAGEEITATSITAGRKARLAGGEHCAPLPDGEQNAPEGVNNSAKGGEQCADIYNIIYNSLYNISSSHEALAEQQQFFFAIFFFRNAADPAEEARKFIGFNNDRGWQADGGRIKYDTLEKRCRLAQYGWTCRTGYRLIKCEYTDRYYEFLKAVIVLARERGGIDPARLLDLNGGYRITADKTFVIRFPEDVKKWYKSLPYELGLSLMRKYIGDDAISFEP